MSDAIPRAVDPARSEPDAVEVSLRPQTLAEFVGQRQLRDNLRVFIDAAKSRGEALDHVLLSGPPGLGKTTLAQIAADDFGVPFEHSRWFRGREATARKRSACPDGECCSRPPAALAERWRPYRTWAAVLLRVAGDRDGLPVGDRGRA